jgi:(E)-4-hydroxy-3-methylbut-2-enyl-diphosphate synthase
MNKIPMYTSSVFNPSRRKTLAVKVGTVTIGGNNPIVVQSMTTTNTKDVDATVEQALEMVNNGCELVRITVPTAKDAEALGEISKKLKSLGCHTPLSADIHFQPRAAMEAVKYVEKIRINPGNYVDKGVMHMKDWSQEEWDAAVTKVREKFGPLVEECKKRGVAIRIGTNHGSLSNRMLWKFGDTVEGMVESAIEYLRVCEELGFDQIIFSMKASNPKIVVEGYRMLAARLDAEHKPYPFHVGVTEAGEGEDGRLKSALGIGALLLDGIGDTIRVSLTENPVAEIPVAEQLIDVVNKARTSESIEAAWPFDPYHYNRRKTDAIEIDGVQIGAKNTLAVVAQINNQSGKFAGERKVELARVGENQSELADFFALTPKLNSSQSVLLSQVEKLNSDTLEIIVDDIDLLKKLAEENKLPQALNNQKTLLWSSTLGQELGSDWVANMRFMAATLQNANRQDPILLRKTIENNFESKMLISAEMGALLIDGIGDAIEVTVPGELQDSVNLSYDILQAAALRRTKTEFVSCPSCGRTLFDLEEVTAMIKSRTGHLKDVAIAIMGCIVNGPGEMADADFGYVGGAPNKIQLYVGRELVQKNIPEAEAADALIELIKEHGKWEDPK